jgi:hypothetical protein
VLEYRRRRIEIVLKFVLALLAVAGISVGADAIASHRPIRLPDFETVSGERSAVHIPNPLVLDDVSISLLAGEPLEMPGLVDSNSPLFRDGDTLFLFNSSGDETLRSSGPTIEELGDPTTVIIKDPHRGGRYWIEAIWQDPADRTLYGWYHLEPDDVEWRTAPVIGALRSWDQGLTWEDLGPVIESRYPYSYDYENYFFSGGNGDFTVVPDVLQEYFYFVFTHYAGPVDQQGIAVARSAFADRGAPGTVWKYYDGNWSEPGIGGLVSPMIPARTGWAGPAIDEYWGPAIHWNSAMGRYVMLLNRAGDEWWTPSGVFIAFSHNLLEWTELEQIAETDRWYPQLVGLNPGDTDTLLSTVGRLFIGGLSEYILQFDPLAAPPF